MEYRGIVMVISDITQINKAREKVELLANLVENAQYDMMFIVNPNGQITECNSLARSSLGYAQSEILGLNMKALLKSDADRGWGGIVDSLELDSKWRGEILPTSKNGNEFTAEMTVSRPVSKEGNRANTICFMRDITERKRAENELAEARGNAARVEQPERELKSLEQLSRPPDTALTAQSFGLAPLRQGLPDTFNQMVERYGDLMEIHSAALKSKTKKGGKSWIKLNSSCISPARHRGAG